MTQITFRVGPKGKLVRKSLENLAADIPRIGKLQIFRTMQAIVRVMKVYPAPPPGSAYTRTMKLKRGWRLQTAGATGYRIKNVATFRGRRYPVYVIGDATGKRQAGIHKGRWRLLFDVSDEEVRKLPDAIVRAMRRSGKPLKLLKA